MDVNEKLCLWCKHFYIHMGEPGWSEYTPGSEFTMDCRKNRWTFEPYGTEQDFRFCILAAKTCPDYEFNESLADEHGRVGKAGK